MRPYNKDFYCLDVLDVLDIHFILMIIWLSLIVYIMLIITKIDAHIKMVQFED